jgi:hypothetical protein
MENQEVKHYQVNGKYRIVIERAASTKGVDGFKIEVNNDDLNLALDESHTLYEAMKSRTTIPTPEIK